MIAGAGELDRGRRPAPGPAPAIRLPHFQRFRLANGLRVLAVRHDNLPQVSARLVLPFGAAEDPRRRAGTALLVARALTEGTTERPAGDVAEWLDLLGVRFRVDVDHDATTLGLRILSHVLDGAFEFLAEVVACPAFEAQEVQRLRDERLDEIASGLDEPRIIASLRLGELTFGEHPYGVRPGGVEETVREITADVLRGYHSRFYRPSGATLILVGDVPQQDELRQRLETVFCSWQGDPDDPGELAEPTLPQARRLWAVQWEGPQSEIRIGGVGISRADQDYPAVQVMNAILGGLFSSRINMKLREEKGWTYGAGSHFDARKRRGPYYIATAVDAKATVDAVREILAELERMQTEPPRDEELELAKNALTLSLPRLFETVGQVSGRIAQQVIYGLPDDFWETYPEKVRAVTRADVQRLAGRFLCTQRAAIVVVGPARDFQAELESVGPLEIRDIHGRAASL